ncbi:MAG: lactate dehydrogenase [Rhizorhabdus sp.]|nr:lactate dehydrogenase [Rhizorhabdus sp.]
MTQRNRIAIIGAGHVGSTAAYALMLRALFSEIVLVDQDAALAQAEAADISDANALARPARIWAGDYVDAAQSRIAVITAGAATHGDETRLSVAARSGEIVRSCVAALMAAGFDGILLIASNPVDLMTHRALRQSGLPAARVIGTGTLLDSSRLRQTLAARLNIAPGAIDGLVLGEHGDSEVAAFSTVRVGGLSLDDFAPGIIDRGTTAAQVRDAGYRIVTGKGYTSYGVATAIVRISEAVLRDEHMVLPVSTLLTGQFGIDGVYLSLPCILGAGGVERVLLPDLAEEEIAGLRSSAGILREAMAGLG